MAIRANMSHVIQTAQTIDKQNIANKTNWQTSWLYCFTSKISYIIYKCKLKNKLKNNNNNKKLPWMFFQKVFKLWYTPDNMRRKWKCSTIFRERTRKGHRQSDEHWNGFKSILRTLMRVGAERIWASFKSVDTVLNRTELNQTIYVYM